MVRQRAPVSAGVVSVFWGYALLMNISVFFMTLCKLVIYPVIIISKLNAACGIPNEYIHLYARQGSPLRREMIPEFIRAGTAGFGPTRLNKPLLQPIPCRCPSRYPDGVTGSTRIDLECDDAQTEESPRPAPGTAPLTGQFPAGGCTRGRSHHRGTPGVVDQGI